MTTQPNINSRALVITGLLAAALYFTYGQFSLPWISVLPIIFILELVTLRNPKWFERWSSLIALVMIVGFLGISSASLLPAAPWLRSMIVDVAKIDFLPWMRVLFGVAALLTLVLYFVSRREASKTKLSTWIFALILLTLTFAYALVIPSSPKAQIDVWTLHEQAADAFIHFHNPYTADYINIYPKELQPTLTPFGVNFAYLPGVFIWMAPFKAVGLDTRYSQIVATFLTAILLFLIARRVRSRVDFALFVPSLLFFTFPLTSFFIVRGWNDNLSLLFFALAAYAMCSRRTSLLFIACNALFLLKQYAILFVPFLIWFAVRRLGKGWLESIWKSTIGAALICGAYAVYDWRNFFGSLYGLHFLKHPEVHQVFPDRVDSYSLMNYLHVFTGLKSSCFFVAVVLIIAARVIVKSRAAINAQAILRGCAAIAMGMIVFAPTAFANYYEYALGLLCIAFAAEPDHVGGENGASWEWRSNWWVVGLVATRSLILFVFNWFAFETHVGHGVSQLITSGRLPYFDFTFRDLPTALIPSLAPLGLQALGDKSDFLSYHTLFELVVVAFDLAFATFVFTRRKPISNLALSLYVFGPLLLAPVYYSSPTVVSSIVFAFLIAVLWKLGLKSLLVERLGVWICDRKKKMFFASLLVATGLFVMTVVGLTVFGYEVDLDPFLFPTHLCLWILVFAPLFSLATPARPTPQVVNFIFIVSLVLTLGLTTALFFNLESVLKADSTARNFVWIRNSLLGFSAIIGVWDFYRSRIAQSEV